MSSTQDQRCTLNIKKELKKKGGGIFLIHVHIVTSPQLNSKNAVVVGIEREE